MGLLKPRSRSHPVHEVSRDVAQAYLKALHAISSDSTSASQAVVQVRPACKEGQLQHCHALPCRARHGKTGKCLDLAKP
eukprot:1692340-Pleurochrysis_carterae.AAC.2